MPLPLAAAGVAAAYRIADTETAHALAVGLHRRYLGLFRTALERNQ